MYRRLIVVFVVSVVSVVSVGSLGASGVSGAAVVHGPLARWHVASESSNWAGYAAHGTTFTHVRATWVQPAATCASSLPQAAAFWVGLDGYESTTVEQVGTDVDCNGINQSASYGWYEMAPAPAMPLPKRDVVRAGDTMIGAVNAKGSTYTLTLADKTAGWKFSIQQTSATAQNTSGEWIAEAPTGCAGYFCSVLPLANFGRVRFTNAAAMTTLGTKPSAITTFAHDKIVMATRRQEAKAQPSILSNKGTAFTVVWNHI